MIKRAAGFMKGLRKATKDADEEAERITGEIMLRMDRALAGADVKESDGGKKYDADYSPEQIAEWEKPITLQDVETLRSIGRKSINDFTSEEIKKAQKWAYKFYKDLGVKSPFFRAWFGEWRRYERSNYVNILKMEHREGKNPRGQYKNNDTGWIINSSSVGYDETISHSGKDKKSLIAMKNIDKVIENAVLFDTEVSEYGRGKKSVYTAFMHKFYAIIDIDGKNYIAKMAVDESHAPGQDDTNKKFYHVRAIEIETAPSVGIGKSHTPIIEDTVSTVSISDLYELVKTFDKDFSPAPEVSEYVLNEDGTPKVFYHGTRKENGEFWEFDYSKAKKKGGLGFKSLGQGNYFTSNRLDGTELYGSRVIEAYLSIKNPLTIKNQADFRDEVSKALNINASQMTYPSIQKAMKDAGYDGVVLLNEKNETAIAVTFDSQQIKSATDNIGTFDKNAKDIRYDLKKKNAEGKEEVSESFKNAVARMYEKETKQAQNTAEAFKEGNKVLNKKLEESRAETKTLSRKIKIANVNRFLMIICYNVYINKNYTETEI